MVSLLDTNVLVYRYDPRDPGKMRVATELLREGIVNNSLRVPHQAVVEFMAAVTRPIGGGPPLLSSEEARRESEEILLQFPVLYPNEAVVRAALRGMATYQLSWFDAHILAYADHYGLAEILSEDFQHGRWYGSVRVTNPFVES